MFVVHNCDGEGEETEVVGVMELSVLIRISSLISKDGDNGKSW